QLLIENAVKHNTISDEHPLNIDIFLTEEAKELHIENNINERIHQLDSTGVGLVNIRQRYKYFTKKKVEVVAQKNTFRVSIPLIDFSQARSPLTIVSKAS
ncbi:MAG: hypothetical protein AAFU03_10505, partial [Bacteroidota bacterium]